MSVPYDDPMPSFSRPTVTPFPTPAHPDTAALAAYLDRRLPEAEARAVAEHLITCATCRGGASDVARVTRAEQRRKRAIAGVSALGGIAAVVVLVALPRGAGAPAPRAAPAVPVERAGEAGSVSAIRVWSGITASTLAWSPVAAAAQYRVTLTDAVGDEVFSAATADTVMPLPASLALAPGRDYFWVVDAIQPDGATATSGTRRITR